MRILEINKFYNAKRGADKHFLDVAALLEKNGHQVAYFSMLQKDDASSAWSKYFLSTVGYVEGFTLWQKIKGTTRMFYSFEAHQKIKKLLDEFKPGIVHIHNIYHQMDPTILFEIKKRGIPIVMTVHDYKLINPNHSLRLNGKPYTRCAQGKYYQCFWDKCVKNSYAKSFLAMLEAYWHGMLGTYRRNIDVYLCPSEFVKNILLKWGIDEHKLVVLPHFIKDIEAVGKKYEFKVAESYALCMGKISKEKGVDELVKIFSKVEGMKLYLAGEIENGFEISKNENIKYLGFLSNDQLKPYIENAKCIVSGSTLPETFGLVALEAMQMGKPFVGFGNGAYGEIIENGIDGIIANSKKEFIDAIEKIATGVISFEKNIIISHTNKFNEVQYNQKIEKLFLELIA
jgi:glycosyltransferase involved in cell wall biosynthesis